MIEPIQKAGLWRIKLRVFWGTTQRDYERPLDIWLETVPSVLVSWINGPGIPDSLYSGSQFGSLCDAMLDWLGTAFHPLDGLCPPAGWSLDDKKRATILLLKDGANDTPPDRFTTSGDLQVWLRTVYAFKFAEQIYSQFAVRDGVPRVETGLFRDRTRSFITNSTRLRILPDCYPPLGGGGVPGQPGPTNDTLGYIFSTYPASIEYQAISKPSYWGPQAPFLCWLDVAFPYIWTKAIFDSSSPDLKTPDANEPGWRSDFPTTWGYVPENWPAVTLRTFPVRHNRTNVQVEDPTTFIFAPNLP